jgi:hypothetical protein
VNVKALRSRLDKTCVGLSIRPRPWALWRYVPRLRHLRSKSLRADPQDPRPGRVVRFRRAPRVRIKSHYRGRPLLGHDVARQAVELRLAAHPIQPAPRSSNSVHTQRGPSEAIANTILALRDAAGPSAAIAVYWSETQPTDEVRITWEALASECAAGHLRASTTYRVSTVP